MSTKLNLIKNLSPELSQEKVILPNVSFRYLTFKSSKSADVTFEVTDISFTGMQLSLKSGEHHISGNEIDGDLHWHGASLKISGKIKWKTDSRIGVEFYPTESLKKSLSKFFSPENVVGHMKPIHQLGLPIEIPSKLKYWLKSDGPFELFVWKHSDGEWSKFQFLMMENYVEWNDGLGLRTGRVFSKRDLKSPLLEEDEFTFVFDEVIDVSKVLLAKEIHELIPSENLDELTWGFILRKLA